MSPMNSAMSRTLRTRLAPIASYTLSRAVDVGSTTLRSGELDLREGALRRVLYLEVLLGREAEHRGEQVRRERHQLRVVVAHVPVVEAARELDLVLGVAEVFLQLLEGLHRLQLRVVLGDGE